ncbi:putative ABC-class ATPase [Scopulibacillus darangshiensis]|uniref:Putative ABC-class ATPase n=1 Tax=Scopulibacillus darangshiensis TaxID=442528 RepID=A0A4R2P8H5_9BACL|nr:ABC-ATPase domain-containing protein [Scopulibacillus darangshiensis]TCP31280.1 putative ABC-class ATPase [Scopulibacillus darangshiensis]
MEKLKTILNRIDGKGYKAYKDIKGSYIFSKYRLTIDAVQGDPFASPSKIRLEIPRTKTSLASSDWTKTKPRKIRCEDLVNRFIHRAIRKQSQSAHGTGKSGLIMIDASGQEVLERSAVSISEDAITICLSIGLPARGRRILAKQAEQLFFTSLPTIVDESVFTLQQHDIDKVVRLCDQQEAIRDYIKANDLLAFIADDAILPRESGVSERPLKSGKVIPFRSPDTQTVSIPVPHRDNPLSGMAVKKGITLVVGGGFHGKSTLLQAIEKGIYDHIEGDGREFVITDASAVKIRAEDGRSVSHVDISPFISNLPFGKETTCFSTENASGSTSQAAGIIEALEAGANALLMDEDTCATNFMIRDARMQALVAKASEPITPFIDKIKPLFNNHGVSTILVMGGTGDYFDVADQVIRMENYSPFDVTKEAKEITANMVFNRQNEGGGSFGGINSRCIMPGSLDSRKGKKNSVKTRGKHTIQYGSDTINLGQVEQLADESQTRMIAEILYYIERESVLNNVKDLASLLDLIEAKMDQEGLGSFVVFKGHPGELARPRRFEIAAAINRKRHIRVRVSSGKKEKEE